MYILAVFLPISFKRCSLSYSYLFAPWLKFSCSQLLCYFMILGHASLCLKWHSPSLQAFSIGSAEPNCAFACIWTITKWWPNESVRFGICSGFVQDWFGPEQKILVQDWFGHHTVRAGLLNDYPYQRLNTLSEGLGHSIVVSMAKTLKGAFVVALQQNEAALKCQNNGHLTYRKSRWDVLGDVHLTFYLTF